MEQNPGHEDHAAKIQAIQKEIAARALAAPEHRREEYAQMIYRAMRAEADAHQAPWDEETREELRAIKDEQREFEAQYEIGPTEPPFTV